MATSTAQDKHQAEDVVIGPMPNAQAPPTKSKQSRASQIQAALLCGIINGIITIPVMTSFAAIIFQVTACLPAKLLDKALQLLFLYQKAVLLTMHCQQLSSSVVAVTQTWHAMVAIKMSGHII